jgi:hypothetical protein
MKKLVIIYLLVKIKEINRVIFIKNKLTNKSII